MITTTTTAVTSGLHSHCSHTGRQADRQLGCASGENDSAHNTTKGGGGNGQDKVDLVQGDSGGFSD